LLLFFFCSRKDLTLKGCKVDVILITGMLSPYASMVEKLHRDVEKERVTILKIERAGDVLADAVSLFVSGYYFLLINLYYSFSFLALEGCSIYTIVLQRPRFANLDRYARR